MKRGREKEAFHNLSRCEPWHLIYFTKRTADAHIVMSWGLKQDSCFPSAHHRSRSLWKRCLFTSWFPRITLFPFLSYQLGPLHSQWLLNGAERIFPPRTPSQTLLNQHWAQNRGNGIVRLQTSSAAHHPVENELTSNRQAACLTICGSGYPSESRLLKHCQQNSYIGSSHWKAPRGVSGYVPVTITEASPSGSALCSNNNNDNSK